MSEVQINNQVNRADIQNHSKVRIKLLFIYVDINIESKYRQSPKK